MKKITARAIAFTALGAAMVVVAQYFGQYIPEKLVKQLVTGTLVNCVLLVFTLRIGVLSGASIGVISAVLAGLLGISQPFLTPLVAGGNALLCLLMWLLHARLTYFPALLFAAAAKCAFLWVSVSLLLQKLNKPPKMVSMLTTMFSWPQMITALCGGVIAWLLWRKLPK